MFQITAADVYDKLKQVKFSNDDSGNPHTWAGLHEINAFINDRGIKKTDGSELAYYIAPNNFSFDSEESIKDIAKHICKREGYSKCFLWL